MSNGQSRILVVEDEQSLRTSMSLVLAEFGYGVQCAEDGFCALSEIRREMPQILLSDLNMPRMSGFELLSVVRRRFPAIQTIAMSGAFSGVEVPPGIAADAFYPKGTGVQALLDVLQTLSATERPLPETSSATAPFWIHQCSDDPSPEACVTITCPECLRAFPQALHGVVDRTRAAKCLFCHTPIHFAVAQTVGVSTQVEPSRKFTIESEPRTEYITPLFY